MRCVLENQENLELKQAEVTDILVENGKVIGVQTYSAVIYHCKAVILCTGTYLKSRCIYGEISNETVRRFAISKLFDGLSEKSWD